MVRLGLPTLEAGSLRDLIGNEVPSLLVGVAEVSGEIGAEALSASTSSSALVTSKIVTAHNNQPLVGASSEGPKESNLRRSKWLAFFVLLSQRTEDFLVAGECDTLGTAEQIGFSPRSYRDKTSQSTIRLTWNTSHDSVQEGARRSVGESEDVEVPGGGYRQMFYVTPVSSFGVMSWRA